MVRAKYRKWAKENGKKMPAKKPDPRVNFDWEKFNQLLSNNSIPTAI